MNVSLASRNTLSVLRFFLHAKDWVLGYSATHTCHACIGISRKEGFSDGNHGVTLNRVGSSEVYNCVFDLSRELYKHC
jgi:hypothetical protein